MSVAKAKKACWRAFSEYVKYRDTHPHGTGKCISCDKILQFPNSTGEAHCGHYYARSTVYANLYFSEENSNLQCNFCNQWLEGHGPEYRKGLVAKYGIEVVEELENTKSKGMAKKYTADDYKEMAKGYRAKTRQYKKERGIQ